MGTHLLAIDQGTTGSTALVMSTDGRTLGRHTADFPQHFPQPGWVEHDAEEVWESVAVSVAEALRAAGVTGQSIAAIGITNQRETTLVWERSTGRAIRSRDRLARSAHGSTLRRSSARGGRGSVSSADDRARARSLFLRNQDRLVARSRRRGARSSRARRALLRNRRHVRRVAAFRRRRARDRRDQRVAHAAHESALL